MLYCDFEKYYFKGNFTEVKHNGRIYIIDKERRHNQDYLINIYDITDNELKRLHRFLTSSMHYNEKYIIDKYIKTK